MTRHAKTDIRTRPRAARRRVELAVLAAGIVAFFYFIAPTLNATSKPDDPVVEPLAAVQDFSKFSHGSTQHTRMPCLLCHQRTDNSTRPKMPGHSPCTGCHQQQFNDASS